MKKCYVDFETQSEVNIKLGGTRYALHPSTRAYCLAFTLPESEEVHLITNENKHDSEMRYRMKYLMDHLKDPQTFLIAHNAYFDAMIWNNTGGKNFNLPEFGFEKWRCTSAKCSYYNIPAGLEAACEILNLDIKKDIAASDSMKRIASPAEVKVNIGLNSKGKPIYEKTTRLLEYSDAPEDFNRVYKYCVTDVEAMIGLDKRLWDDIPEAEHKYWVHTCYLNRKGVKTDVELATRAVALFEEYKERANDKVSKLSEGAVTNTNSRKQVIEKATDFGYELKTLTRTAIEDFLKDEGVPQILKDILNLKVATNKSSVAKYKKIVDMQLDGTVYDLLKYYGASTGRMSGQGIQIQNLPKGDLLDKNGNITLHGVDGRDYDIDEAVRDVKLLSFDEITKKYGDVGKLLIGIIRHAVMAEEGKTFYVADFASVEPRMLALVSGQEDLLTSFRNNAKIYEAQAAFTFKKKIEEVNGKERFVGKTQVLACGYGMGAKKFQTYCAIQNQHFDLDFCQKAIDAYREKNDKIKAFWKVQETNAKRVVKKLERQATDGFITWYMRKEFLCCRLPSGRTLHYFKPFIRPKTFKYKGEEIMGEELIFQKPLGKSTVKRSLYGGLVTENIVQALCRDVLLENILKCEEAGYRVAFHVHDEVVAEVPEGFGSLQEFERILCSVPKWAEGFPLATESWSGKRYKK